MTQEKTMRQLLDLDQVTRQDIEEVGPKSAHLGEMLRLGWPVPPGFCVPASVHAACLKASGLDLLIDQIPDGAANPNAARRETTWHSEQLRRVRAAHTRDLLPIPLIAEIESAYTHLLARPNSSGLVAVRSSARGEDTVQFSAAGLHESYLGISSLDELLQRVVQCWASVWTESALSYRRHMLHADAPFPSIAVIVQEFVQCDASGVAFTLDPTSGQEQMVVEAAWGLNETVVRGEVDVHRYLLDRETLDLVRYRPADMSRQTDLGATDRCTRPADMQDTLAEQAPISPVQLRHLGELALLTETHFGSPQDIEWGRIGDELFVFQSRPITGRFVPLDEVFTHRVADDHYTWTSGFVNERFPNPVSPLGWSLIREPLEALAMREPLRFIGADSVARLPLTKLRHGHPYANLAVFEALYRPFPRRLLPEDVSRYFPNGDVSLIRQAKVGHCLFNPSVLLGVLRAVVRDPGNWSPWHNHRRWRRFLPTYQRTTGALELEIRALESRLAAGEPPAVDLLLQQIDRIEEVNARLLRYHRWSLTHADVLYSLVRRALVAVLGERQAGEIISRLLDGYPSRSREADDALRTLSTALSSSPQLRERIANGVRDDADVDALCGEDEVGLRFRDQLRQFLDSYGHRSLSLDILRPSLRDDPRQLLRLALDLGERSSRGPDVGHRARADISAQARDTDIDSKVSPHKRALLWLIRPLMGLASVYLELREEQRFYWQKGLALLRRMYLLIGGALKKNGTLLEPDDIFFLTKDEVAEVLAHPAAVQPLPARVASRRAQFRRLEREFELAPSLAYPPFLLGDQPLPTARASATEELSVSGVPVSGGRARGPARIVRTAAGLDAVRPGEILVTTSPDPGWTPVFGKISGLVMEYGGQLSHGSVVAREYGLPAVARVNMVTELLRDGDQILVDGYSGLVVRLSRHTAHVIQT